MESLARPRLGSRWRMALEGFEEIWRRRVDHQHIAFFVEARLVGFQAAIELGELRVAAEGFGVDAGRLRGALALALLCVAVGVGDRDFALTVGVGPDFFTLGSPGGA